MKEAADKSGAELNYNTEMIDIPYADGKIMKTHQDNQACTLRSIKS
jgi:hypothetical protein